MTFFSEITALMVLKFHTRHYQTVEFKVKTTKKCSVEFLMCWIECLCMLFLFFLPFGYAYGCGHNTDFRVYKGPDMVRPNTPLSYGPACNCSNMINKFTLQRTCYDSLTPPISRKIIMLQFSADLNVYCNIALTLAVTTSTKWDNSGIIIKQLDFHSWS